jgi:hypothetical protein
MSCCFLHRYKPTSALNRAISHFESIPCASKWYQSKGSKTPLALWNWRYVVFETGSLLASTATPPNSKSMRTPGKKGFGVIAHLLGPRSPCEPHYFQLTDVVAFDDMICQQSLCHAHSHGHHVRCRQNKSATSRLQLHQWTALLIY